MAEQRIEIKYMETRINAFEMYGTYIRNIRQHITEAAVLIILALALVSRGI